MSTKGERHHSKEVKAKAILDSVTLGDDATCRKYGISPRTLFRWLADLRTGTDSDLTASVSEKKAILDQGWAAQIPEALSAGLAYLKRAAEQVSPKDPEAIHAVAGAVKIISEVDGTYKMIDARIRGQAGAHGAEAGQVPAGSNVTPIRRSG